MSDKKGLLSFLNIDSIVENLSGYVEKRMDLFKIELKEDLALGAARLTVMVIMVLSFFMVLLFLSIASALLLNNVLESNSLGFVIVAGFYLLIFLVFYFLKDETRMEEKLQNKFLDIFNNLKDKNGNE